jgi:hypothetical protein
MIAGRLEIELMANIARLQKDVGDAKQTLGSFASDIDGIVRRVNGALGTIGVGLSVAGMVALGKITLETISNMKELAQEAGTTAAMLSKFEAPARMAGSSLESVSTAMFRVSQAAVEARDPASKAAQAFASIGISTKLLRDLSPDQLFELASRQLAKFSDSMEKNAVMQTLFSKSGKEMSKVAAEIAEKGQLNATVTNEQAEAANKLLKDMVALKMQSEETWRSLVSKGVPALTAILEAFNKARSAGSFFQGVIDGISQAFEELGGNSLKDQLERINKQIEFARAAKRDLEENGTTMFGVERTGTIAQAAQLNDLLRQRANIEKVIFDQELEAQNRRAVAGLDPKKPKPNFDPNAAAGAAAYAAENAELDKQISKLKGVGELEAYIEKLQGDRYRFLTPAQKQELIDKEKIIVDLEREKLEREEILKSTRALIEEEQRRRDLMQSAQDADREQLQDLQFQVSLVGKSAEQAEILTAQHQLDLKLKQQIADLSKETDGLITADLGQQIAKRIELNDKQKEQVALILKTKQVLTEQQVVWNGLADAAGNFFSDLIMHGKSAFDSLRQYVKQLLADMIALFAKRWFLQLATGSGGDAGSNTVAGGLLNMISGAPAGSATAGLAGYASFAMIAGSAVGTGIAAYQGAGALGAGQHGQQTAGLVGAAAGAAVGTMILPVIGTIIGAVLGAIVGKFTDPDGLAQRTGRFGTAPAGTPYSYSTTSPFGTFGTFADKWFSDSDMKATMDSFLAAEATLETNLAAFMTPEQRAAATAGLAGSREYNFGTEHGDFAGTLGDISRDRLAVIAEQLVPGLGEAIRNFKGSVEDLWKFVDQKIQEKVVSEDLAKLGAKGLDLAALKAWQHEGESLVQAFQRIAAQFATFDDTFMSDAQKLDRAKGHIKAVFDQLGLALPQTTDQLIALVHGLDLSTEAGRHMFDELMKLFPDLQLVFKPDAAGGFTTAIDHATKSVNEFSSSLGNPRKDLGDWLNKLVMDPNLSTLTVQERFQHAENTYKTAVRLGRTGELQGDAQQYLDLAKQLFGQSSPEYTAILHQVYEQVGKFADGEKPFQEAFNAALPKGSTMASSADFAVANHYLAQIAASSREIAGLKEEVKGLRRDMKDKAVKPFGAG